MTQPIIFRQPDGTFVFNWETLPIEEIRKNTEFKDKIFQELKDKYKEGTIVTSRDVFEMNKYVIDRIKNYKAPPKVAYSEE